MVGTKIPKFAGCGSRSMLVLVFVFLIMGCQTIQYESRLMKKKEAEGVTFKISASEMRLRLDDLAGVFSGVIEMAADQVIAESTHNDITRHALLWKINAIPMVYRSLFQPDPVIAFIDTWVFSLQMINYFEHGPGKQDFDQWYRIALDASRRLEKNLFGIVANNQADNIAKPLYKDLQSFAQKHPLARDFLYRESVVPVLGSEIGMEEIGAIEMVGSLAVSIDDIAHQFSLYIILLTKQARWQAELVMADATQDLDIQKSMASLNDLLAAVNRITPVLENAPDLISRERVALLKSLRQERIEVLANIERQRLETLTFLERQRLAITDDIQSERRMIMDILQSERKAILESIDKQRIATLIDIESAGNRIVDAALEKSKPLIDHLFYRAMQILMVLLVAGVMGVILLLYLKRKRKSAIQNV